MSVALINHQIITWARKRADLPVNELVHTIHQDYRLWDSGEKKPTFKQAQNLAKKLFIPFGYLYFKEPPMDKPMIPDLRTIGDLNLNHEVYSVDLKDVISDAIQKQDWYRDYLRDNGYEKLSFIGSFDQHANADNIVQSISETLHLSLDKRTKISKDTFLKYLTEQAEKVGICVIRNGKVGSNTHRPLNVDEFRGFALPDPIAPLIFINASDAPAAQIFTFAHELAHLWIGETGVSNCHLNKNVNSTDIEKLCNQVAGELLVPGDQLKLKWDHKKNVQTNAEVLTRFFKVSSIVIARRALDLGLVNREDFFNYYAVLKKGWQEMSRSKKSGGSFYNTFPVANSALITKAIVNAVYSERMLMRDGVKLLGVTRTALDNYARQGGMV